MSNAFSLYYDDKEIRIESDEDKYCHLVVSIDYDDVDHEQIDKEAKRLLRMMNKHAPELLK